MLQRVIPSRAVWLRTRRSIATLLPDLFRPGAFWTLEFPWLSAGVAVDVRPHCRGRVRPRQGSTRDVATDSVSCEIAALITIRWMGDRPRQRDEWRSLIRMKSAVFGAPANRCIEPDDGLISIDGIKALDAA